MTQHKKQHQQTIPAFRTLEEEAAFWDTHDFTEYHGDFKPVKARFAKRLSQGISIRFDDKTLRALRAQAQERGIGPTTLVRMWILEHLHQAGVA